MKKYLILLCISSLLLSISLTSCANENEHEITASARFYYSIDSGRTYGDSTKEYLVGETVFMQVIFTASTTNRRASEITATLSIPSIDAHDAHYIDGQIITPEFDPINNVTIYEFTLLASPEGTETSAVIMFIPNSPAMATMTVVFDDSVSSIHNVQNTIVFIDTSTNPEEGSSNKAEDIN